MLPEATPNPTENTESASNPFQEMESEEPGGGNKGIA